MVKRKISKAELERRVSDGARVRQRRDAAKTEPAPKPEPAPAAAVTVSTAPELNTQMAAMAASMAHMQQTNERMAERLTDELTRLNNRTHARVVVTERNQDGGIDAAEIEIIE